MSELLLNAIDQAQLRLGSCSRSTIYNLANRGEIEFVHIGRRAFVTEASLRAYVDRLRAESGATAGSAA